jgi:phage FluMu gp28-like protein
MEKLERTGYTWEEAPQNLKNAAVKLASGLNITPVEAYKLLLEKITEQDLKDAIARDK